MKSIILLLLSSGFSAWADIPQTVKDEIDQRIQHQLNSSIVIGVYEKGQSTYYVQGLQNQALNQAATSKTVYEIGSISKTFTSLLLAQLIDQGKIQLDSPVQDYWPKPFSLIDSEGQAITVKQLATHTSGLPRLPANLNAFSKDPYADYDREMLVAAVQKVKASKSGVNYLYSNFAVGLLGETLAVLEQSSYNDLITDTILQPLNLNQTFMLLERVPEALLAQGYSGNVAASPWRVKALAGAGAIRSSIEDLLAYGVAHLEQSNDDLKSAMQLATTTHYRQGGLKVGLGWHINSDGYIWHNGGTAGFSSMLMYDPVQQKVVAGITNSSPNNSIEDITTHLMNPAKAMTDHEFPMPIDADQLNSFTGTFYHQPSDKNITIIKHKGRLFFTAIKQPRQAMTYIGNDTFKLATFKVKLAFQRDETSQVTALDFTGLGKPQTYQRTTD